MRSRSAGSSSTMRTRAVPDWKGSSALPPVVAEAALLLPELILPDYDGEVDESYPDRLAKRVCLLQSQPELLEVRRTMPTLAFRECNYDLLSQKLVDFVRELPSA